MPAQGIPQQCGILEVSRSIPSYRSYKLSFPRYRLDFHFNNNDIIISKKKQFLSAPCRELNMVQGP